MIWRSRAALGELRRNAWYITTQLITFKRKANALARHVTSTKCVWRAFAHSHLLNAKNMHSANAVSLCGNCLFYPLRHYKLFILFSSFSALGSFYIPTLVMLFFYWRIYHAAVSTTRAINRGFRTTKSSKMMGSRWEFIHTKITTLNGISYVIKGK